MTSKRVPLLVGVAVAGTALLTVTALGAVRQPRSDQGRQEVAAGLTSSVTQNGVQVTAAAGIARVAAGGGVPLTVTVRSKRSQTAVIDLEAFTASGRRTFQRFWVDQQLTAGGSSTWTVTWTAPAVPGRYRIAVGVFTAGWTTLLAWNSQAAFVVVAPSAGAPASPRAASPSTSPPAGAAGSGGAAGTPDVEWGEDPTDDSPAPSVPSSGPGAAGPAGSAVVRPGTGGRPPASVAAPGGTVVPGAKPSPAVKPPAASVRRTPSGAPSPAVRPVAPAGPAPRSGGAPTHFHTLAVGAALPDGDQCATWVRAVPVPPENKSVNLTANSTPGAPLTGALGLLVRVDGRFTGTTEQILRWTACKWGVDEDLVKAQAAVESWWRMDTRGDWSGGDATRCAPGHELGVDGTPGSCPESFGILQVRYTSHQIAFPLAVTSTALNTDYAYAQWRECFVGDAAWLNSMEHGSAYAAGDAWGCLGVWFSGRWHTPAADQYVDQVRSYLDRRIWTTPGFTEL